MPIFAVVWSNWKKKEIIPYDVIVVGAGAAGMMAAGTAARNGKRVLLIEKMEKSGRKVRITGKGRCNVTNARPAEEFASQVRTNAEFFRASLRRVQQPRRHPLLREGGREARNRARRTGLSPSGKAWDIATALLEYCFENGVKIIYNTRVTGIMTLGSKVFGVRYINKRGFERKGRSARTSSLPREGFPIPRRVPRATDTPSHPTWGTP